MIGLTGSSDPSADRGSKGTMVGVPVTGSGTTRAFSPKTSSTN